MQKFEKEELSQIDDTQNSLSEYSAQELDSGTQLEEDDIRRPPTFLESAISGTMAAVAETLSLHWTTAERFREQVGAPKSASLRVLYKSLLPDLISMIPITILQIFADASLRRWMGGNDRYLSTTERIGAAMLAGMTVSPLSSYAEMLMLLQQKYNLSMTKASSYLWHLRGFRGFTRGLLATSVRDSFYCGAYLGVAPALKEVAEEHLERYPRLAAHNHWLPFVLAGPSGGLLAAVVTQPIDCIKSQQQSMFRKVTISEAIGSILASDGYYGFFKGIRGRAKRVTFGVVVMSYINDKMQDWLTRAG